MAATALLIYVTGLVLAFGWRTRAQLRATGDKGLRLDAGPAGSVGWWAKLAFIAALALGFAGPLAALAGLAPLPLLDAGWLQPVGLLVALTGTAATLAAQSAMGGSWRVGVDPDERTALVTSGMFAQVRNPVFTAMLTTSLGLTLMVPNLLSVAAYLALFAAIEIQIRAVEEPYLTRAHPDDYPAYAARVGRLLPGVGRLSLPAPAL